MANSTQKKRCFVVMGFGEKTDYATGRKLDLNQSYKVLIKPVVEEKGLLCQRADEIKHAGVIDEYMYQELFQADIVIADLSTANLNAFYELGVRHALRPYTTIVISENKLAYPFNLNHISILPYTHMGADIGYSEVQRFRKVLGEQIDAVLNAQKSDSPVYTFLEDLVPPSLKESTEKAMKEITDAVEQKTKEQRASKNAAAANTKEAKPEEKNTLSKIAEQGEAALRKKDYKTASQLFKKALEIGKSKDKNAQGNNDSYLIHRLALTTYKSEKPNVLASLKKAINFLMQLDLKHTNDPETVALAGAIEKKLFEHGQGSEHLSKSILYYERGYFLLNNRYNAINLAYVLNCRVDTELDATKEEKIADLVDATRVRKRVLQICDKDYKEIISREKNKHKGEKTTSDNELLNKYISYNNLQKFWIWINRAEAYFGLGEFEAYKNAREEAKKLPHEDWMLQSLDEQVKRLEALLKKHGHLMNPPWKMQKK